MTCVSRPATPTTASPTDAPAADWFGRLVGDKGYVGNDLFGRLITRIKSNMRNCLMPLCDKLPPRKRAITETIIGQLKNVCRVEHARRRSPVDDFADVIAGVVAYAYAYGAKLPSLHLRPEESQLLDAAAI